MTIREKVIQSLTHSTGKTRKQLIEENKLSSSALDAALREMIKNGEIGFTIISRKEKRPIGMKHFVKEPNHNVREYFLIKVGKQ